jgi:hypothetical protein
LSRDFIVEASRLFGDASVNDKPEISNLIALYSELAPAIPVSAMIEVRATTAGDR